MLEDIKLKAKVWRENPAQFCEDVWGVKLEKWQKKAFKDIVKNDRLAIRSGHGVGKTAWVSMLIIWWLMMHEPCKIACTAPTGAQLHDVLWAELRKWMTKMPRNLRNTLDITTTHLKAKGSEGSFAVARTARKEQPEAFQGFHSDNMLFIVDEASGVDDIIFEVGAGAMSTEGAKTILTGNPTRSSGYFYDCFHKNRKFWSCMKVSCLDSTRVSKKYALEMEENYGADSSIYAVRVLGDFPRAEDDKIISLELAEAATVREVEATGKVVWGLDVARFGDDRTALAKRKGNTLQEPIKTWKNLDVTEVVGRLFDEYQSSSPDMPELILVDSIGIGAGVVDLGKLQGLPVVGVNVAEAASASSRYNRLRDELWFKVRDWLMQKDCKLPKDDELIAELTMPRYTILPNGKLKAQGKDEIKKEGRKSPDLADAFCLTFAPEGRAISRPTHFLQKMKVNIGKVF